MLLEDGHHVEVDLRILEELLIDEYDMISYRPGRLSKLAG